MRSARESARHRRQLVESLESRGRIRSAQIRNAFLSVPRELFVDEFAAREGIAAVYRDDAILTKRDARGMPLSSSSQPAIMALMLEQLGLEEGMRVLEVGAGTGYNAALISVLVGPRGRVVTVDIEPELVRGARRSLRAGGYRARVVLGDGRDGVREHAPYDRIVVTASADAIPVAWSDQLRPDGRVEVPLRLSATGAQAIPLLRKTRRGLASVSVICGGFMPLRRPGESSSPMQRVPTLAATDTDGSVLRHLSGHAVGLLSARARRRLLATALSVPRRVPLGMRAKADALTLFLTLQVPQRHLVTSGPTFAVGVIDPAGAGLAILTSSTANVETVRSMLVYGNGVAETLLRRYVDDWRRAGRPGAEKLEIAVAFGDGGGSRVTTRWPHPRALPARSEG